MDFNKYYLEQTKGSNYPVFRGAPFQRGYGLGNAFRKFISWAIPLLKEYALPIAKNVGKEIVHNVANVATDAIEGKDIKESARENFKTSLDKLKQTGRGIKRKKNQNYKTRKITKRYFDIFDR